MQGKSSESRGCTVILPEKSSRNHLPPGGSPPPETPEPQQKKPEEKKKTGTGSSIHLQLFREEELAGEPIDLTTDSSPDFRRLLEQSSHRYRIEKLLATGGFGQVFLAEDRFLGRKAVIKSLKQEFLNDPSVVDRFIAEAKLSSQLKHPSIVPLYSLDTDSIDGLHIAMQLIRGITLQVYLARSLEYFQTRHPAAHVWQRILRERLEVFIRICDAISYCHDRKIIHNDLKPENIMIADFGQVYVMDWGIASVDGTVCQGGVPGTVSYMAPERIATRVSNQQTDVFSLGMILNELVTLRGPVTAEDSDRIIEKICTGDFEPSTSLLPKYRISRPLRAIIEKARSPRPAARYASVKQLAEDIRHYLFYEEVKACPDGLPLKTIRFLFRHKQLTAALLGAVLILGLSLIFLSYHRRNVAIRNLQQSMLVRQTVQAETDRVAETVGQNLRLLQEQIRSIGNTLKFQLDHPTAGTGVTVHRAEDLSPERKDRVPGLVHTAYYNNPVTLDYGVFHTFGKRGNPKELQQWAVCFRGLHYQMLSAMFMNTVTDTSGIRNDKNRLFHLRESLIRQMIFLIGDRLAYTYPGMYEPVRSSSDFQSDYVQQEFRAERRICWSPPYMDRSGSSVIACWQRLYDSSGKTLGSIGFEISFQQLLKPLLEHTERESSGCVTMVVDQGDRSLFSTYARFKHRSADLGEHLRELSRSPVFYHYPGILRKIRQQGTPSNFPVRIAGKTWRIYWSEIPCVRWLLIRHMPED